MKYSIIIADDHPVVFEGIKNLLKSHNKYDIMGYVKNGDELFDLINKSMPDLIILDNEMPGISGIDLAKTILSYPNPPKIVLYTFSSDKPQIYYAYEIGISGFVFGFIYIFTKTVTNSDYSHLNSYFCHCHFCSNENFRG